MATQPDTLDLDEDLPEDVSEPDAEQEQPDPDNDDEPEPQDEPEEADVITFGEGDGIRGEEEPEGVRNLREALKREKKARQEAEARLTPPVDDVGEKPDIDDYFDKPDEYDRDYDAWKERKQKAEAKQREAREVNEAVEQEIADSVATFERQRSTLRVPNFDGAYDKVAEKIGDTGTRILGLVAGEKSAALAYALGNSTERLDQLGKYNLGKITDLVRFAADIGRMAGETRVERRKPATLPESVQRGSSGAGVDHSADKLRKLEAEAERTRDRTKLIAFKRSLKENGK